MAIQQHHHHHTQHPPTQSFSLDALYCEEEQWADEDIEEEEEERERDNNKTSHLLEQDLFWEDEELLSLFSKEEQSTLLCFGDNGETETDYPSLSSARTEAVEWMLKVKARYGFSALTAILSINYFDRFLTTLHFQKVKPWMIQLAAVTCVSLAAKVEETQVPLLLELQVEGTKYVFEAKNIQKMELLVMSSLQWRMNPVTPLSFLDHIVRRLGLKTDLQWEFFRRCEGLLLSLVADSRFVRYLPSVLATATMFHVIHQVQPCNHMQYQNQLLCVLKTSKEKVNECYELIVELSNTNNPHKRKYEQIPNSPSGVIDASFSCDTSSNHSSVSSSSSSSSSPREPLFKKTRSVQEQHLLSFPSLARVFVDVTTPR